MNLEEYLSFASLSLAQTDCKRLQNCLNISEQEKFYHYITLKRWMADYQKNILKDKNKYCDCFDPKEEDKVSGSQRQLSCSVFEQVPSIQIQQKNAKQECRKNNSLNIVFKFFQQLQHRFKHDRKELHRISIKLKLRMPLEKFEIWVRANLPTSQSKYTLQSTISLMNSTKNKQESLLLRVLLKQYLKNKAYVQILTSKDNKQMSLKDNLSDLRRIGELLFQQNK